MFRGVAPDSLILPVRITDRELNDDGEPTPIDPGAVAQGIRWAADHDAKVINLSLSGYGDFKADLADALIAFLAPVRERYTELRGDPAHLQAILEQGAAKAQAIARENLALAKERMGFLPRSSG